MLIYALVGSLLTFYVIIASFALFMTYDEQCRTKNCHLLYNTGSFLACVFWPVTVLGVILAIQLHTPRRAA